MTEHTRTDGIPELPTASSPPEAGASSAAAPQRFLERSRPRNERMAANKIECNACPVLCQITEGAAGACDRYANQAGALVRLDPVLILQRRTVDQGPVPGSVVPFLWAGTAAPSAVEAASAPAGQAKEEGRTGAPGLPPVVSAAGLPVDAASDLFVTGVGSSTTYPDYKPAPFIVSSVHEGVDMVTVVTEGIFSYCSFKVKIDTDRWLGPEQATVRCKGEAVGHVTTAE